MVFFCLSFLQQQQQQAEREIVTISLKSILAPLICFNDWTEN
jgi:hypothetical protein